jgi:hypothetical protein
MHKTVLRSKTTLAVAGAQTNSSPATMNVDSMHYHHGGSSPNAASERHDAIQSGERIETIQRITPPKDAILPVSMNKQRLTSKSTSNSPVAAKTNQKSSKIQLLPVITKRRHNRGGVDSNADGRSEEEPQRSPQQQKQQQTDNAVPIAVIEQPAAGTDPNLLQRPIRPKTGLETDFFLQPTILSRLILHQKYGRAIQRVFEHSEETSTWLCAKHNVTSKPNIKREKRFGESSSPSLPDPTTTHSIRQLPIHLACSNLCRTQDTSAVSLLNELISVLVFAYPDGAHTPDHRSIYPIQEAIWYGVAPETVAIFFMAKPESLLIIDHHGRTLSDINQYRKGKGKEAIQLMIDRGVHFWKVARDEAALRLQRNNHSYPSENRSIDSESVLASPNAEEDTILTIAESVTQQAPSFYEEHATPLAWDQLEQRAKATEQILTAVNEENFQLRQKLESLTNKTSHTHTELMKELKRLDRENAVLNEKLYQLEQLIKDKCVTDDEAKNEQFRLAMAEVSSLIGISEKSSLFSGFRASDSQMVPPGDSASATSQRLYDEAIMVQKQLAKKHTEQREKIRKLRHMVSYTIINDATLGNDSEIDRDGSLSYADVDTISALSIETARSNVSEIIHKNRFHYNEGVVDRLPSEGHVLDDLSKIIWYASSRQEVAAKKRGTRVRVQDDLSGILRWAAKKDRRDMFYSNNKTISVESTWSPIHPKEIWRALPRRNQQGVMPSSKNRVPPPTTRPTSAPPTPTKQQYRSKPGNSSPRPRPSPAGAVYTGKSATTATNTTSTQKKAPPKTMESFDSVYA